MASCFLLPFIFLLVVLVVLGLLLCKGDTGRFNGGSFGLPAFALIHNAVRLDKSPWVIIVTPGKSIFKILGKFTASTTVALSDEHSSEECFGCGCVNSRLLGCSQRRKHSVCRMQLSQSNAEACSVMQLSVMRSGNVDQVLEPLKIVMV